MARRSQVQKQVLSLYRSFLREAADKPGVRSHIQNEFRKNKSIPKTNITMVEYLIRRGKKQLKDLQKSQITSMGVFTNDSKDNT